MANRQLSPYWRQEYILEGNTVPRMVLLRRSIHRILYAFKHNKRVFSCLHVALAGYSLLYSALSSAGFGDAVTAPGRSFDKNIECVILLHGLARSSGSMEKIQINLEKEGFLVANVNYPSTKHPIEKLAKMAVSDGLKSCNNYRSDKIHFVTHSLGGILVRQFMAEKSKVHNIHRVVMLGPPNQGSEVVDHLKDIPIFNWVNGPTGKQLGTEKTDTPKSLGPVMFELGVIAGTHTVNLILSTYLPKPNDGKVSVEATKVAGMKDFIALPTTHTFMMRNRAVIHQTLFFLKNGVFDHSYKDRQ